MTIATDGPAIRETPAAWHQPHDAAAPYVRVSTSDREQTVENQLQPLQEAAGRLGWSWRVLVSQSHIATAGGQR